MDIIVSDVIALGVIAFLSAMVLYFVSQKFKVEENPKIDEIEQILPGANCGACGKAGCRNFAEACVKADAEGFKNLYCPVGGASTMKKVADSLGFVATEKEETVAVLKCNGTCQNAPAKLAYDAPVSCRLANLISVGQSGCPNGCLRQGDCVKACPFGALSINPETGIPQVDENKCTSCGACVKMCPRGLFEIRPKGKNGQRVYVACSNKQKGAVARKNCSAACIGCMKCTKICDKIKVENNLSYIPTSVSAQEFGAELVKTCPTGAIVMTGVEKENAHD